MAKLVILNQGMTGRIFDLNVERTTVGRVEDNTFQIADGSVSSHHAEILLHGSEILIRDLNSTNGSFINNEKIAEAILKPGQTLRFGQVELKIDDGKPMPAGGTVPPSAIGGNTPAPMPLSSGPGPAMPKRQGEGSTMVMPRGVSLQDLEQGGARPPGFDTNTAFTKKKSKVNKVFVIAVVVAAVVIIGLILYAISQTKATGGQ